MPALSQGAHQWHRKSTKQWRLWIRRSSPSCADSLKMEVKRRETLAMIDLPADECSTNRNWEGTCWRVAEFSAVSSMTAGLDYGPVRCYVSLLHFASCCALCSFLRKSQNFIWTVVRGVVFVNEAMAPLWLQQLHRSSWHECSILVLESFMAPVFPALSSFGRLSSFLLFALSGSQAGHSLPSPISHQTCSCA